MQHHQYNSCSKQTLQLTYDGAYPRPKTSLLFYFCFTNQVLYHGGEILTMNSSQPEYVDCIVTEGETILYSGKGFITIIFDNDSFSIQTLDASSSTNVTLWHLLKFWHQWISKYINIKQKLQERMYKYILDFLDTNILGVNFFDVKLSSLKFITKVFLTNRLKRRSRCNPKTWIWDWRLGWTMPHAWFYWWLLFWSSLSPFLAGRCLKPGFIGDLRTH